MTSKNQIVTNFKEEFQDNVDLGTKYVTKSYLMDLYPYLTSFPVRLSGLQTWGYNYYGQLGQGSSGTNFNVIATPSDVIVSSSTWKQVACGYSHTCSVKTDGTLWSFGLHDKGQLGDNSVVSTTNNGVTVYTSKITPTQVGTSTTWKQVSCGYKHSAGIKNDGTLWTWGLNDAGQLGDNTKTNRSSPVQTNATGTNWKQVSCGYKHSAGIKNDGTLWTWGLNDAGQLGDTTSSNRSSPVQVSGNYNDWRYISCGWNFSLGIRNDGSLWGWGENGAGQLGDGTQTTPRTGPVNEHLAATDWKTVSCGKYHAAGIKEDGSLYTWGQNTYGQLANITVTKNSYLLNTTIASSYTNFKSVACGLLTTNVLKTDGSLWVCGYNQIGSIGDNTSIDKFELVREASNPMIWTWKSIASGHHFSAGIQEFGDDF